MKMLKASELAKLFSVSERTIYELAQRGEIPSVRIGRCVRFSLDQVAKALGLELESPKASNSSDSNSSEDQP